MADDKPPFDWIDGDTRLLIVIVLLAAVASIALSVILLFMVMA
jgi:hypothetical protein